MSTTVQFDDLVLRILSDKITLSKLRTKLLLINSDVNIQAMNDLESSFCFKFQIKSKYLSDILKTLNITPNEIQNAFTEMWGKSAMRNRMHSDLYYQVFLFCLYIGVKSNDDQITKNSLFCILMKLWNGRKAKFIPYCDPKIMQYVAQYMTSKKHLINRYSGPYDVIVNYFVPTLLSKYESMIKKEKGFGLQRLFEQAYSRIRQMFVSSNMVVSLKSGKKRSSGGILPMYKIAKSKGYSIDLMKNYQNDNIDLSFTDFVSGNNLDDIITNTINDITGNSNYKYSPIFISNLNKDLKVSVKIIDQILHALHNPSLKLYNDLYDILALILQKLNIKSKDEICKAGFAELVNKKILKSKNNPISNDIRQKVTDVLHIIFKEINPDIKLLDYSNLELVRLRKIIIRGLIFQLRKNTCV